jgi:hypothetical protein
MTVMRKVISCCILVVGLLLLAQRWAVAHHVLLEEKSNAPDAV